MSYYHRHVFFCCNKREPPEKCCANAGAVEMQAYAKSRVKALGLNGKGQVRIDQDRPFLAAVEAAGLVDAHLSLAVQAERLDAARKGRSWSSTPKPSGTPMSTAMMSTRTSIGTSSRVRSSSGC